LGSEINLDGEVESHYEGGFVKGHREGSGTEKDLEAIVKIGDGAVKFMEPDGVVTMIPEMEPEDSAASLWGLARIGTSTRANEGDGVTVFILDTGVRTSHQDFGGRGIPTLDMTSGSPVECGGSTSCAADNQGHGTHCAGTAVGSTYGVAAGATVRSIKVLILLTVVSQTCAKETPSSSTSHALSARSMQNSGNAGLDNSLLGKSGHLVNTAQRPGTFLSVAKRPVLAQAVAIAWSFLYSVERVQI